MSDKIIFIFGRTAPLRHAFEHLPEEYYNAYQSQCLFIYWFIRFKMNIIIGFSESLELFLLLSVREFSTVSLTPIRAPHSSVSEMLSL